MKTPSWCLAAACLLAAPLRLLSLPEAAWSIPSTAETPRNSEGAFVTLRSGRILFFYSQFYGGSNDSSSARIAVVHSDDQGGTWSQPEAFAERGDSQNLMSVSALRLASGRIALVYLVKKSGVDCRPYVRLSDDEGATWSKPRAIVAAPGYFVLNNDRIIQTRGGRLIVPVAFDRPLHSAEEVEAALSERANDYRGVILWYLSDDEGATWREADTWWTMPVPSETGLQEPGAVELSDGSLFSWARTGQGAQYGFRSTDNGQTWSPPAPTELKSPCSPATIKRIPGSDALLAAYNDHSGRFPYPREHGTYRGRSPLVLAVSRDGGRTWPARSLIEGDLDFNYAYIAMHFVGDCVLLGYSAGPEHGHHLGSLILRRIPLASLPR